MANLPTGALDFARRHFYDWFMVKIAKKAAATAITMERTTRLFRLVKMLATGPQTRAQLLKRLKLAVRGFYRDLMLLREVQIHIQLHQGKYQLVGEPDTAWAKIPLPDPDLNLGEAHQLAKGKSKIHQRLRAMLAIIEK